jgi:hypothetical protein
MCGNTIGQDRRFMVRYMPKLEAFFHYRNIDVSTLKELGKRWKPEMVSGFKKRRTHGAGRHRRIDRRTEVLPRALHQAVAHTTPAASGVFLWGARWNCFPSPCGFHPIFLPIFLYFPIFLCSELRAILPV